MVTLRLDSPLTLSVLVTVLLALAACAVEPSPSEGTTDLSAALSAFGPDSVGLGERADAALAKSAPGYAGVWFDPSSNHIVLATTGVGDQAAMDAEARTMLANRVRGADVFPVEARTVKYTFAQLATWRNRVRNLVFEDPGTVALDLDERSNQVRVFTVSDDVASRLAASASKIGIPPDALVFELSSPVESQVLVTDKRRPVEDGFQIVFDAGATNNVCTLGANVWAPGGPIKGFLTASHCSKDLGTGNGVNSIDYYQNDFGLFNKIGDEAIDPLLFTGGYCPAGKSCRWSDVLWADYTSDSYFVPYKIAETTTVGSGSTPGSLTVARYRDAPSNSNVLVGFTVRKTGRTSGTTQGSVSGHCVDVAKSTTVVMLCQDIVNGPSQSGDSGSPAYLGFNYGDPNSDVYHVGIQWGGIGGTQFIVSPWLGIVEDTDVLYNW